MTAATLFLVGLGGLFVLGVYAVILDACLAEQMARIRCNQMFRNLGIEPIYSLEDVRGYSIDTHVKRTGEE